MWNHLAVVAMAATASIAAAEGLITLDGWRAAQAPAAVVQPAVLSSTQAASAAPGASDTAVVKGPDGHFWAEGNVDGRRVRFLVDTGATAVALTLDDARRLGLDPQRLDFSQIVKTAAGDARAAVVDLDYVAVAGARVDKVQALVLDKGLSTSLLGMSYLGRLSRIEATPGALILRP
jgi:aspartyl protease family protein